MPKVSIVLPTYNRADVLPRALSSIAHQIYNDWELVVVDDGSTDSTEAVLKDSGVPLRYLRAQHGGVSAARNIGIRSGNSDYVAFLDSDDEWDPAYLSICAGFLDANPKEHIVATELLQDFGGGRRTRHPYLRVHDWYPELAVRIGSRSLDLPPGESDPYMRVFSGRDNVTNWVAERIGRKPENDIFRYHGNVFPHFRWGYLFSVTMVVVRRSAIHEIGLFDETLSSGEDYLFIAEICRKHKANLISWPGLIKHEFDPKGRATQEGHLATSGRRIIQFYTNLLKAFEILYGNQVSSDQELQRLKGYWLFTAGDQALKLGDVPLAQRYLGESISFFPELREARKALRLTEVLPEPLLKLYGPANNFLSIGKRLFRGSLNVRGFARRVFGSK